MSKYHNVLPTRITFSISSAEKTESVQEGIQNKTFRVTVSLQMTAM